MRDDILEVIGESPGIHFRQLERAVGCSTSTLNYHLRDFDAVREKMIGGYRRFYPSEISSDYDDVLAELNHPARGKILYLLGRKNMETPSELSEALDIDSSTVSHHLKVLKDKKLVNCGSEGRKKNYTVCEGVDEAIEKFSTLVTRETGSSEE